MVGGRTRRWAAALLCASVLAGCTDGPAQPMPSPTPSVVTPTETDAERQERLDYAAAEKAYRTFRAEYGRVLRAGGAKEPTKVMKETAGGDYLSTFAEIIRAHKGLGIRTRGQEKVIYVQHGGYQPESLVLNVCEDSRGISESDESGKDELAGEIRTASIEVKRIGTAWKLWSGEGKRVASCE